MPVVEKTNGGSVYIRAVGQTFAIGDQADVSPGLAAYLVDERGDFQYVDEDNGATEASNTESDDDDAFDLDEFLEQNVPPIEEAIADGEVDDHLEAIDEASERVGVQDAVGQRRAELEG